MANARSRLTCYYWADGERCKFTAEECRYAHYDTGTVALVPKKSATARKQISDEQIPDDLISLTSGQDNVKDEKKPHTVDYEEDTGGRRATATPPGSPDASIAGAVHTAISKGKSIAMIEDLLASEPHSAVKESLSLSKHGVSAILAAVERRRPDILRLIITHGADPNARDSLSGIPVLAWAVFQNNASAAVSVTILLELGADPFVIPRDLWDDGNISSNDPQTLQENRSKTHWCDEGNRNLMAKCLNLTVKHCLVEAAKKGPPSKDKIQADKSANVELSNHLLIGQGVALHRVNEYMHCHLLCGKREPLVLAFVGPRGHGKTELARRIGAIHHLISSSFKLPRISTVTKGEKDVADTTNNRTSRSANNMNVVYIEDSDNVNIQLLKPILDGVEKGDNDGYVDTSKKTVVIITAEKGCSPDFCRHLKSVLDDSCDAGLWETYESIVKEDLVELYGPSLTSRIACTVPFVPFSKTETTLLVHKYILDAAEELTKSCLFIPGPNSGKNLNFTVDADKTVCEYIGETSYDNSVGARSIERAVFNKVKLRMVEEYTKVYPSRMLPAERRRVTKPRPLNFVVRLNPDSSVSVVLE